MTRMVAELDDDLQVTFDIKAEIRVPDHTVFVASTGMVVDGVELLWEDWTHMLSSRVGCVNRALDVASRYAMVDGAHHKQWVIDQMLRAWLGDEYDEWVARMNSDPDCTPWDIGIAP